MPRRDDIGKALDNALHAAFPAGDVGYPQTPHTERARAIMNTAIAIAGVPVRCYNFHEVGRYVNFNVSYPDGDGRIIGAWHMGVRELDTLSDATIIQQYMPIFEDYKGERRPKTLKHDPDDR